MCKYSYLGDKWRTLSALRCCLFVALLWAVVCAASEKKNTQSELDAWLEFKQLFNKSYANAEEDARRMKTFLESKKFVESHNTRAAASSTKFGINEFSDLTNDEFNKLYNGFRESFRLQTHASTSVAKALISDFYSRSISQGIRVNLWQSELDYREQKLVSPVKHQLSCGSCWAFATTGALESLLLKRGKNVSLSEQDLIDCSWDTGNRGCHGGSTVLSLEYVHENGIISAEDYPYTGDESDDCKNKDHKSVIHVQGSVILPSGDEELLRQALVVAGPLPVVIYAGLNSFQQYKSGVYTFDCDGPLNHAVLLVGYGTDSDEGDYWLIKNSWGLNWGESGYMRLARNQLNKCGVASYAVVPIP